MSILRRMEIFLQTETWIALLTLTAMEIVLGIDNIVFIAILVAKLRPELQEKARRIGISLALIFRLALLFGISWMMGLTKPLFTLFDNDFSGRDLILLFGGLFLLGKATFEIHDKVEGDPQALVSKKVSAHFMAIIIQILLIDLVFSLDSVITAVGMAQHISIMVIAMLVSVGVMLLTAKSISEFVEKHPTIKILALSFLLLIGVLLIAEGMGLHVGKGYIYFAMGFSLVIELLNMRYRSKHRQRPI